MLERKGGDIATVVGGTGSLSQPRAKRGDARRRHECERPSVLTGARRGLEARPIAGQEPGDREILVEFGPVDADPVPDGFPTLALLRRCRVQPREPDERDAERPLVREGDVHHAVVA